MPLIAPSPASPASAGAAGACSPSARVRLHVATPVAMLTRRSLGLQRSRPDLPATTTTTSAAAAAAGGGGPAAASPGLGLFMEADGAVMDVHIDGHRVAFNRAFASIGMDCVAWAPAVYHDLLGFSDGTGESLVHAYYKTVGWPMMVATSEQGAFARKVHELKQKELQKLLEQDGVPLRPDVKQVISDALQDDARVALLCGTQCVFGRQVAESCLRLLGPELAPRVRVFTFSLTGDLDGSPSGAAGSGGNGSPSPASGPGGATGGGGGGEDDDDAASPSGSSIVQLLSAAAVDLKQRQAMKLACSLRAAVQREQSAPGSTSEGTMMGIDPSILAAGGSQQRVTPEYLAALLATLGLPAQRVLALAAGTAVLQAAAATGMVPVAVPRRFAAQGSFPDARAKFEGYGFGNATYTRLKALAGSSSSNPTNGSSRGGR